MSDVEAEKSFFCCYFVLTENTFPRSWYSERMVDKRGGPETADGAVASGGGRADED